MSRPAKRTTKRVRKSPRRDPDRRSGRTGTPSPTPVFETILRTARGIHGSTDPLEVEALVSGLLGTFDRPMIDVDDSIDFVGQQLVTFLVGKRSPDVLALLHGDEAAVQIEPHPGLFPLCGWVDPE